ncbi:MAG: RNA polymerase sigma factor [candidate division Zixibacteria bacterium]|nr:RNA polymerase sigma factor [candidate division Zixibacteria bacterium]
MIYIFAENDAVKAEDNKLITKTLNGDRRALEELIKRHQNWIYNIALRMVMLPEDAEDVTQEILIKMVTRLSTFKGNSDFRTWLYRIAANHVIDMKRKKAEQFFCSFESYGHGIDNTPDSNLPNPNELPVDENLIVEETKLECISGMLLCLDRKKRLTFILGAIFAVSDKTGSEVLGISRDNFRKQLSRGRQKILNFMNERCSLINEHNSCRCRLKAKALIDQGIIDPENLRFTRMGAEKIKNIAKTKSEEFQDLVETKCIGIFRNMPFMESPDYVKVFREIIDTNEFEKIFNLNN